MPDARQTSRSQAAQARDRYTTRQINRTETFDAADRASVYRGYDANSGLHKTQRVGHEATLGAIDLTNGGLSDGDTVTQTEGDGSFDAMPQARRRRRRRRHRYGTDTLISALFVGSRDTREPALRYLQNDKKLLIWFDDSNRPAIDSFEISMSFVDGNRGSVEPMEVQVFYYYLTAAEKIVQVQVDAMQADKVLGDLAAKTRYFKQAMPLNYFDLLTIRFVGGKIAAIEATSSKHGGDIKYSDDWKAYLPYLWRSQEFNEKILGDDPTHPDLRLTLSPAGRFELKQPPKTDLDDFGDDGFRSLKNFFGNPAIRYALSDEKVSLELTLDELGITAAEQAYITPVAQNGRSLNLKEAIATLNRNQIFGVRGSLGFRQDFINIQCHAIRGIMT